MANIRLDGAMLVDAAAFHAASQKAFGFPATYGHTFDAWVDCLSYLRDEEAMAAFHLGANEVLTIEIHAAAAFEAQAPDLLEEMRFCIAAINDRYADYGELPALALVLR
jgi:hypothetical protein